MNYIYTIILLVSLNYANAQLTSHFVLPSSTDAAINTFTSAASLQYHTVYFNQSATTKNLLFLFLPGSDGIPLAYDRIDSLAANMGYHAIGLMYPNSPSVGSLCAGSSDSLCFEKVRMEIIDGVDRTNSVNVDTTNCIEHRLVSFLKYLELTYPNENWGQYLGSANEILWNKMVVTGHSQGGGHAGIIAKNHKVKRVVFFASPKDYNQYYNRQAAWYNDSHLTPSADYYGFSHSADDVGSTPIEQLACYTLLGMGEFGSIVNVDTSNAPFHNTRMLTSSLFTSDAHGCVVVDNQVKLDVNAAPVYLPVWQYMLDIATTTKIMETTDLKTLNVYPNPTTSEILVSGIKANDFVIEISNVLGEKVLRKQNQMRLDVSHLPKGLYYLLVSSSHQSSFHKIIIE